MNRIVSYFLGHDIPYVSRVLYPLELRTWALLAVVIGSIEGAVVGVLIKNVFAGQVGNTVLNFAVAIAAGSSTLANIFSFLWASLSSGRDKVKLLTIVQALCAICVLLIAVAPISGFGLVMVLAGTICARICWSGAVTLRAVIWRANYPRYSRAGFAGRITIVTSLVMAATGLLMGWVLDTHQAWFRFVYPIGMVFGLLAAYSYRRMIVRGHTRLVDAESADPKQRTFVPSLLWSILRKDALYRRYMLWTFIFGCGNLMVTPILILVLTEHFDVTRFTQVFLTSSLPLIVIPLTVPLWSRMLDAVHVIQYRAINSWVFFAGLFCVFLGANLDQLTLLFLGSALFGSGLSGGILGWNLGHNDFAPPEQVTQYMGINVTLTGIRGLIAPVLGVAVYELLEANLAGAGSWALSLPVLLSFIGALGYLQMRNSYNLQASSKQAATETPRRSEN